MHTLDLSRARWRKSSRSNGGSDGNCVEVAFEELSWRKSSRSNGGNDGACVEVAFAGTAVAVRDSKDPAGPVLAFPESSWRTFRSGRRE